jgi:PAS domain S-box-containing protein
MVRGLKVAFSTAQRKVNMMSFDKFRPTSPEGTVRPLEGPLDDVSDEVLLLRNFLEETSDGMVIFDLDGTCNWANRSMQHICGQDPSMIVGRDIRAMFPPSAFDLVDVCLKQVAAGQRFAFESAGLMMHGADDEIQLEVFFFPLELGESATAGGAAIFRSAIALDAVLPDCTSELRSYRHATRLELSGKGQGPWAEAILSAADSPSCDQPKPHQVLFLNRRS